MDSTVRSRSAQGAATITWTAVETIISVVAIILILALSAIV